MSASVGRRAALSLTLAVMSASCVSGVPDTAASGSKEVHLMHAVPYPERWPAGGAGLPSVDAGHLASFGSFSGSYEDPSYEDPSYEDPSYGGLSYDPESHAEVWFLHTGSVAERAGSLAERLGLVLSVDGGDAGELTFRVPEGSSEPFSELVVDSSGRWYLSRDTGGFWMSCDLDDAASLDGALDGSYAGGYTLPADEILGSDGCELLDSTLGPDDVSSAASEWFSMLDIPGELSPFEVVVDFGAYATAELVVEGLPTDLSFGVGFSASEQGLPEVAYAYGSFASPRKAGFSVDVLSPQAAALRDALWRGGWVVRSDDAFGYGDEDGPDAATNIRPDIGDDAVGDDVVGDDVVGDGAVGDDAASGDVREPPLWPGPGGTVAPPAGGVDLDPGSPSPADVRTVSVSSVSPARVFVPAVGTPAGGSMESGGWVLPGWMFDTDAGTMVASAAFGINVSQDDTFSEERRYGWATFGGPPLAKALAELLVGLDEAEAVTLLEASGAPWRMAVEGSDVAMTTDFIPWRMFIEVSDGKVVSSRAG